MLYVFVGPDIARAKKEARALSKKTECVFFGEGNEPFQSVPGMLASRGLFSSKVSLVLDRPLETPEGQELVRNYSKKFHESDSDVFIIQPESYSQILKNLRIEKKEEREVFPKGVKIVEFGKKVTEERLLPFAFSDAFMSGDRKRAWIEYHKLLIQGTTPEEVHGTLSWAVRSSLVAAKTKSAEESGLKPFVYAKSKRVAEKKGIEKVEELSRSLVSIYHRARAGEGDMTLQIEKLILE